MNIEMENHGGSTTETPLNEKPMKCWMRKVLEEAVRWLSHIEKDQWLEQMRGTLSLMATVIATMTFNMALNPPGGVKSIKDDANPTGVNRANANPPNNNNGYSYPPLTNNYDVLSCSLGSNPHLSLCPGEAVLAVIYPKNYFRFLVSNTICFVASLSVCVLLASGIPLHHRLPMWLLSIAMCVTLTTLALSYIIALEMTTPSTLYDTANNFLEKLVLGWIGLLVVIVLCHTLRFIIFVVKFFCKRGKSNSSASSYSTIAHQRVN